MTRVTVKAELQPLEIELKQTGIVVIDMQNTFICKGGMFDLYGENTEQNRKIIPVIQKILAAARNKGCKIVYTRQIFSPDLRETGGPESVHWHRGYPLLYRTSPALRDKLALPGTWGYEIIDEVKPEPDDLIVDKPKYSGFFGTNLDMNLNTFNLKYLIFTGVATNVCVESTIRDAYYLNYWSILVSDACANSGPPFTQEATLWNVKRLLGWITTSENVLEALK
ncbi:MAG: cysteine hydrolase [Dehalococcoidia bacterium]|nr:cysteine hydrolase [Dehalococcoidia bacterium]